jgi:preprotein translocase subunit YajC
MGLLILVVTFALMWVLFILPQQRRVKAHQALVRSVGVGDEIVSAGGVYGRITSMDDESVSVEVAPGIELRLARGAISRRIGPELPPSTGPIIEE